VLALVYGLNSGTLDSARFEDESRSLLGPDVYLLFTVEKLVAALHKQLVAVVADEKTQDVLRLVRELAAKDGAYELLDLARCYSTAAQLSCSRDSHTRALPARPARGARRRRTPARAPARAVRCHVALKLIALLVMCTKGEESAESRPELRALGGCSVGVFDGALVGALDGCRVGLLDGALVGAAVARPRLQRTARLPAAARTARLPAAAKDRPPARPRAIFLLVALVLLSGRTVPRGCYWRLTSNPLGTHWATQEDQVRRLEYARDDGLQQP
jgi:hypothetical protein